MNLRQRAANAARAAVGAVRRAAGRLRSRIGGSLYAIRSGGRRR